MMLLSCESVPSDDRDDDLAVSTDNEKKLCSGCLVLLGLAAQAAGDLAIRCQREPIELNQKLSLAKKKGKAVIIS